MYKSIHLQVTEKCNANCKTCYIDRKGREFDIKKIDRLPEALEYAIGGGEPLLYPHIQTLIKKLKDGGKYVAITTNGTIRKDINVDRIAVSIDGHTQKVHSVTHNTPLDYVEGTVKFYERSIKDVVINHILREDNAEFLEEFLKKHNGRNVNILLFKGSDMLKPTYEQIKSLIPLIKKYKKQLLLDACFCKILNHFFSCNYPECMQGKYSIYVDCKENIKPCSNSETRYPCKILIDYGDFFAKNLSKRIILYKQDGTTGAHRVAFRLGYEGRISHMFKGWKCRVLYILKEEGLSNVEKPYFLIKTKAGTKTAWVDRIEEVIR